MQSSLSLWTRIGKVCNDKGLRNSFVIKEEKYRILIFKEAHSYLVDGSTTEVDSLAESHEKGQGTIQTAKGRGKYPYVPLKGEGKAIIRRVKHGGLWGKVMGDLLLGAGRPLQELLNTTTVLEKGAPTAEILGVRLQRYFNNSPGNILPLYRAEVFSKELSGTIDLLQLLESPPPATNILRHKREIIRATAAAIRALHETGLYHNDLHLKNILISAERPFKAYVIDLDKSTLYKSLSSDQRVNNLLRLDRSMEKFKATRSCHALITSRDRLRFLRDYMRATISLDSTYPSPAESYNADWKRLAKRLNPRYTFHRLWWRALRKIGLNEYTLSRNKL